MIRFLTPYIMKYIAKKAGAKFEDFFKNVQQQGEPKKAEGSISIDKDPKSNSSSKSTVGEYVDYEEID